jgi:drug/metabolite transporter (DMT)-like permease
MNPKKRRKLALEFSGAFIVAAGLLLVARYREKGAINASDWRAIVLCLAASALIVGAVVAFFRLLRPPKQDTTEGRQG